MKYQVEVLVSGLNIRSLAVNTSKVTGTLAKGASVIVVQKKDGWFKLAAGGWIYSEYVKVTKNLEPPETSTNTKTGVTEVKVTTAAATTSNISAGLDPAVINLLYEDVKNRQAKIDVSTRLFGSPHQFIRETDFRLGSGDYDLGRKFMESIVAESPIVYFLPGKPNYLPEISSDQRKGMAAFLAGADVDKESKSVIDAMLGEKETKYFRFLSDYSTYMRYVNLLCRTCAIFMGVGDIQAPSSALPYKHYDWSNYRWDNAYKTKEDTTKKSIFDMRELASDSYRAAFGNYEHVQFYVEPNMSFNETTSNTTTQSKLAGMFDSAQGVIKELSFLTGAGAMNGVQNAQSSFAQGMNSLSDGLSGNGDGNFFSRLLGMSSKVMEGSNIIFPEIWGDAAYNKSYSISINLVSPYGDKESKFLNIMVPLMHILALSLPRQTSANSYASPFLVRAFCKGWFSCEMGVIDSVSIEKGGQGSWSIDGMPSEMRIHLSIKDLYSNMMITNSSKPGLFYENTGLIEFLAVTCGIDTTKPSWGTKLDAILTTVLHSFTDIPSNIQRDFIQSLRNKLSGLWRF